MPRKARTAALLKIYSVFYAKKFEEIDIFDNQNQLWAAIQNHWTGIDIQMCQTLADSMLQRYNEALAKNGLKTHYRYHFLNT